MLIFLVTVLFAGALALGIGLTKAAICIALIFLVLSIYAFGGTILLLFLPYYRISRPIIDSPIGKSIAFLLAYSWEALISGTIVVFILSWTAILAGVLPEYRTVITLEAAISSVYVLTGLFVLSQGFESFFCLRLIWACLFEGY